MAVTIAAWPSAFRSTGRQQHLLPTGPGGAALPLLLGDTGQGQESEGGQRSGGGDPQGGPGVEAQPRAFTLSQELGDCVLPPRGVQEATERQEIRLLSEVLWW